MEYEKVNHIKTKVILCKVTSRERPQILLKTVQEYLRLAGDVNNMVWLFSFDEDDKSTVCMEFSHQMLDLFNSYKIEHKGLVCTGTSKSKIEAINRDINTVELPEWDILMNISDDQRPIIKGWDDIIRNAMPDDLDWSLWFTDGQPRVNTQEIVGRNYYNRFGYIYHPAFKSLWCDNLSTDLAAYLGRQKKFSQQIVKHYHPAWATMADGCLPMDALYERNNKFWNEDEATYHRLKKEGLDKLIKK